MSITIDKVRLNAAQAATVVDNYLNGLDASVERIEFIAEGERNLDGTYDVIEFVLDTDEHFSRDLIGPTGSVSGVEFEDKVGERARDLALNDCQMWGNLPPSVQNTYTRNALAEIKAEREG